MQSQIYRILADRSGKPLRQIIRDTKRTDFYLDAIRAKEYGLIDDVLGPVSAVGPVDETGPAMSAEEVSLPDLVPPPVHPDLPQQPSAAANAGDSEPSRLDDATSA